MLCTLLFALCAAIAGSYDLLPSLVGKKAATILLALSGCGMCSLIAVFIAEAM